LRVAAQINEEEFDGAIPPSNWIKMITVNPAQALALDNHIGKLAPGLKADITVLRSRDSDPNQSLLKTHLQDVQMVWVGGDLLYANESILKKVKPGQCEPLNVNGSKKLICVADNSDPVNKSNQTLAEIRSLLQAKYANLAPLTPP
jgi:adenine deaminase